MELTYNETPYDIAVAYAPAWRHEVAMEMVSSNLSFKDLYPELRSDIYIKWQYEYLKNDGDCVFECIDRYDKANAIYAGNIIVKGILEALLLTECPIEAIAKDFGVSAEDVLVYSFLFFNIRDKEGKLKKIPSLLTHFANWGHVLKGGPSTTNAILLKYKALRGGLKVLLDSIGWKDCECSKHIDNADIELKNSVKKELYDVLLNKLYGGGLSGRELVDLNTSFIKEQKDTRELNLEERKFDKTIGAMDDNVDMIVDILNKAKLRPELKMPDGEEDMEKEVTDQLKSRAEEFKPQVTDLEAASSDTPANRDKKLDSLSKRIESKIKAKGKNDV